ncbi:MAG: hypothetical protein ACI399_05945 [Candidatus Cryptobacteroides sp.]
MDAVITYVNGLDPVWRSEYSNCVGMQTYIEKRFRDWGTLKYLLRGISEYMPFIRNVYLVVSGETQVPSWVDRKQLLIVRHSDIIPEKLLPVFNASAIEMFLHRIDGLDEEFLYLNDDFFPMLPCSREDFFLDGKPCHHMSRHWLTLGNKFRFLVRRSFRFACEALGVRIPACYLRPQHTVAPMLKSLCDELYSMKEKEILSSVTPLREDNNYNQYIFTDYTFLKGMTADRKISNKHYSLAVAGIDQMEKFIASPTRKIVCINDVNISESKYETYRSRLLEAFERRFPVPSRFELTRA